MTGPFSGEGCRKLNLCRYRSHGRWSLFGAGGFPVKPPDFRWSYV